ncbi:MAG: TonB-dependent receptor [Bacteroidota bacterium]|nr:TonB-dependent receptor [Bacteroidota bacterium]
MKSITLLESFFALMLICFSINQSVYAQNSGEISGKTVDGSDGSDLVGTLVIISGTSVGTTTDIDGKYRIANLKPGNTTIVFRFLGYIPDSVTIILRSNEAQKVDVALKPAVLQGKEVVITAQMRGQQAAINQQVSSMSIINVVSKDKIQELPDANAAESIGRLPGVSIQRDGGEGSKVMVRGLPAKYNPITIDGAKVPATDAVDRSVDLTMISSDMLAGIEVSKAITPDKDGDAIGGTINFQVKKAEPEWNTTIKLQGGYNRQDDSYNNFRFNGGISNRFFDELLGILIEGNFQRGQRGSDEFAASYADEVNTGKFKTKSVSLTDRHEKRDRLGATIVGDYELGYGDIKFSSMYARTERDELIRKRSYRIGSVTQELSARKRLINTDLFNNILSGSYDFDIVKVNLNVNYSITRQEMPFYSDFRFEELAAWQSSSDDELAGAQAVIDSANNNFSTSDFRYAYFRTQKLKDNDFAGKIDLKIPLMIEDDLTSQIKLGGKYIAKDRDLRNKGLITDSYLSLQNNPIPSEISSRYSDFSAAPRNTLRLSNFYDPNSSVDNFMNGKYNFGPVLSYEKLDAFLNDFRDMRRSNSTNGTQRYFGDDPSVIADDYNAGEKISAGYFMTESDLGNWFSVMVGVRYERTENWYRSVFGKLSQDSDNNLIIVYSKDTVGTRYYEDYLPMIHLKGKITDWMDIRMAATRTLARPDFQNLVPREKFDSDNNELFLGNPYLDRIKAYNYDVAVSMFDTYFGLLSIGGFYKIIQNIDFIRYESSYPYGVGKTVKLYRPENITDNTYVYGFETELQTNFRFLDAPFNGIVLSVNYSRIFSKTKIPYTIYLPFPAPRGVTPTAHRLYRGISMPGQPDRVANVTLGYETGPFSSRVSYIYQAKALAVIGEGESNRADGFTDAYNRWDFSMQYKLPWHAAVVFNINNITNVPESSSITFKSYKTEEKYYGLLADIGLKYEF